MRLNLPRHPAAWGGPAFYALAVLLCLPVLLVTLQEVLAAEPYWIDEAFSVAVVSIEEPGLALSLLLRDAHPPLYYLVLRAWTWVFGTEEMATRTLSLCAALGALALFWWRGSGLFSRPVLAVAAVWICTSWVFWELAYLTRMYTLVLLGSVWLSLAFARLWAAPSAPARREMGWFCIGALLVAMLHYAAMTLACSALLLLLFRSRRHPWAWLMVGAVGTLCLLWTIPNFVLKMNGPGIERFILESSGPVGVLYWLLKAGLTGLIAAPDELRNGAWLRTTIVAGSLAALATAGIHALRGQRRKAGSWAAWRERHLGAEWGPVQSQLWLLLLFFLVLACVQQGGTDILLFKVMVAPMPAMALCLGAAMVSIWRGRFWMLCAAVAVVGGGSLYGIQDRWGINFRQPGHDRDGIQAAARALEDSGGAGRIYAPWNPLWGSRNLPQLGLVVAGGRLSPESRNKVTGLRQEDQRHAIPPFFIVNTRPGTMHFLRARGLDVEILAPDSPTRRVGISLQVTGD